LTNQIGSSVIERFNFEAKKQGRTSIKIVYKRPWEKRAMKSDEYVVSVT
jgi:predicted secreted protein